MGLLPLTGTGFKFVDGPARNRPTYSVDMSAQTIPILPSPDFDATSRFYARLGFTERGRWDDEYLIIEHQGAGIELHFWYNKKLKPAKNDAGCYVRLSTDDEASQIFDAWLALDVGSEGKGGIPRLQPRDEDGEFALVDLHGNLLRLNN